MGEACFRIRFCFEELTMFGIYKDAAGRKDETRYL
jgi:hypothetical protein